MHTPKVKSLFRAGALTLLAAAGAAALVSGTAAADEATCGSLANHFGPFDYRDPSRPGERSIVESNHLNADVLSLRRGQTAWLPINDLDYALRAFPNHLRALDAVSRWDLRGGQNLEGRSAECYFDRAMRFAPDDGAVRMLYGIWLMKRGRTAEAKDALVAAGELMPDSIDISYNLGLAYLKLGQGEAAMAEARKAYAEGYPLPGLRDALKRAGYWKEQAAPVPATATPVPAADLSAPPAGASATGASPASATATAPAAEPAAPVPHGAGRG